MKKTLFLLLYVSISLPLYSHINKSILDEIADINMQTLPWQEKDWEEQEYHIFLKESVNRRINPTEHFKRSTAFTFFKKVIKTQNNISSSVIQDITSLHDLHMFCGQSEKKIYLANNIPVY